MCSINLGRQGDSLGNRIDFCMARINRLVTRCMN
jgi:hypothetical protein